MILIILIIGIIILALAIILDIDYEAKIMFGALGVVTMCATVIAFLVLIGNHQSAKIAETKIEMLEHHNSQIELKVKETVRVYLEHEQKVVPDLTNTDIVVLLVIYPELHANELVKSEINLYIENGNEIKNLKMSSINKKILAWWLWFGEV